MKRSPLSRYGVAILAVGVAFLIKLLVDPLIVQETPFLFVFGAVMVSAWYGGLGPGLATTFMAGLVTDYFFLYPKGSLLGPGLEPAPLVAFVLEGTLVSLLVEALRTTRRRAEEKQLEAENHLENLRRNEDRFRALVQNSSDVITVIDADGTIRYVSPAIEQVMGRRPEDLVGKSIFDHVRPDARAGSQERLAAVLTQPGIHPPFELEVQHRDGSWRLVESLVNNLLDDPSVGGVVINQRDITERKSTELALRRSLDALLALYETGQVLTSSLDRQEIGSSLLEIIGRISGTTAAAISLRDDGDCLYTSRTVGSAAILASARGEPKVRAARQAAFETATERVVELGPSDPRAERTVGLLLPLRVRDQVIGVLEVYGSGYLAESEAQENFVSLANQAATALDNARLYEELSEREYQLEDLVGRLLTAQEEERRRVAYDLHDGLAQSAAAAYQHLQIYMRRHPPASAAAREELERAIQILQQVVRETRQVIADLRPTVLDDFGLAAAVRLQVETLRSTGVDVGYTAELGDERLPTEVETTLFRVAQEAMTNVRKHARASQAQVALERLGQAVSLRIQDAGCGFRHDGAKNGGGPGESVGLSSMRERVSLLGGRFEIHSEPGVGTSIKVEVPLPAREEDAARG
jgi:PAS domain S-box-containing protein